MSLVSFSNLYCTFCTFTKRDREHTFKSHNNY